MALLARGLPDKREQEIRKCGKRQKGKEVGNKWQHRKKVVEEG